MSRILTSTIKGFEGSVQVPDPLTFLQCALLEDLVRKSKGKPLTRLEEATAMLSMLLDPMLGLKFEVPAIPADVTAETFPGSPAKQSRAFVDWLLNELAKVYLGEGEGESPLP